MNLKIEAAPCVVGGSQMARCLKELEAQFNVVNEEVRKLNEMVNRLPYLRLEIRGQETPPED